QRAVATAGAATAAWTAARLTGRPARARTVALAALVGSQLGQTVAAGGPSRAVLLSSAGSAAALAAVIQTPGLSQFFGCTPLGPVAWAIVTGCSAGTTLLAAVAGPLFRQPVHQPRKDDQGDQDTTPPHTHHHRQSGAAMTD